MPLIQTINEQGWDKAIVALAGADELKRIYERCQALGIKPRVFWNHPDYDQRSATSASFHLMEDSVDKAIRIDLVVGVGSGGVSCQVYIYEYSYDPRRCVFDVHTCDNDTFYYDEDDERDCAACDSEYGEDWCHTHQEYH